MSDRLIDDATLLELTGYRRRADQRRWLDSRGWKYEPSANGRPGVSVSYYEERMNPSSKQRAWKPNIAAFIKAA